MRGKFHPLRFQDREQIERFSKEGLTIAQIAILVEISKTTVASEFSRCGGKEFYTAKRAQEDAEIKRRERSQGYRQGVLSPQEKAQIDRLHAEGKSVYQISGITKILNSRIYNHINRILKRKEAVENIELMQNQIDILFELVKELQKKMERK
jgi:IS30 family transposase